MHPPRAVYSVPYMRCVCVQATLSEEEISEQQEDDRVRYEEQLMCVGAFAKHALGRH